MRCDRCGVETETGCSNATCPYHDKWYTALVKPAGLDEIEVEEIEEVDEYEDMFAE